MSPYYSKEREREEGKRKKKERDTETVKTTTTCVWTGAKSTVKAYAFLNVVRMQVLYRGISFHSIRLAEILESNAN